MPENLPDFNHNEVIYSVSEVSHALKRMVEDHFGTVKLRGEISGFKLHSSGHAYFTLKDADACMDAVCWRGSVSRLKFKPEDGLEIVATGKLTTYPGRSKYQIVVDFMEPAGAGALMALLEKRRAMLEAEGLFAASRKRALPYMPRVVGVITSPTGAVIRDILHRIEDRFGCHVIVWPVAVQGEGAAQQIADAIRGFNNLPPHIAKPDILIVARGGGSLEDLWAFNEEIVVRAAANSTIPLISAVGHETDTTLIDFASDKRAPTPTAAAEMAVPVLSEIRLALSQLDARMAQAATRNIAQRRERLEGLVRGLPRPQQLLQIATQRLDDWSDRHAGSLTSLLERKTQMLALALRGLQPTRLLRDISQQGERLTDYQSRACEAVLRGITQRSERLASLGVQLEAVNISRILERGFALVRGEDGHVITSSAQAKSQAALSLEFADGKLQVRP